VAKLVYATVYATADWQLADARSLLVATSLHIKVRTNSAYACFEILICDHWWQSNLVSSDAWIVI